MFDDIIVSTNTIQTVFFFHILDLYGKFCFVVRVRVHSGNKIYLVIKPDLLIIDHQNSLDLVAEQLGLCAGNSGKCS